MFRAGLASVGGKSGVAVVARHSGIASPALRAIDCLYPGRPRTVRRRAPCPAPISATVCCSPSMRSTPRAASSARKIDTPLARHAERCRRRRARKSRRCSTTSPTSCSARSFRLGAGRHAAHPGGRDSGNRRRRGRADYAEGRSLRVPHIVRPAVQHAEDRQIHRDGVKAKTVALVWVNNDFGKGGRDTFVKEMAARNIKVVADDFDRSPARPISPPTWSRSRRPTPTRSSSISTRRRARAFSERPRSRASRRRSSAKPRCSARR